MSATRDVARQVLFDVVVHGRLATPEIDRALAQGQWAERDRAFVTELVYGTLRNWHRLQAILAAHCKPARAGVAAQIALTMGAYQVLDLRVADYAAVTDAVNATRRVAKSAAGFVNAVLRKLAREGEPPLTDAAARASLPRWLYDELSTVNAELPTALHEAPPLFIRVNTQRVAVAELVARLIADGLEVASTTEPAALRVSGLGHPARYPAYNRGEFSVQDVSPQMAVRLAWGTGAKRVLDACAGRGGKTCALAELAATTGTRVEVTAADASGERLAELAGHLGRLGLGGVTSVVADLTDASAPIGDGYDLVMLDAPCTGTGVLRRHPEATLRLTPADVPRMAALQTQLLAALWPRVAPGGRLAYMVCSVIRAEGPNIVAAHARLHQAEVASVETQLLLPSLHGGDGFFVALLHKR